MSKVTVEMEPGYEQKIMRDPSWAVYLERLGEKIVPIARRLAPKGSTKNLSNRIKAEPALTVEGFVLRVIDSDFKAGWFEKGTAKMEATPFLRPAVQTVVPGVVIIEGPAAGGDQL